MTTAAGIPDSGFATRGFEVRVRDAGDSAVLLELDAVIDPAVNARAIAIAAAVKRQALAGVRDVIPTYRSVAVHFDPLASQVDALREVLRQAADAPLQPESGSLIEVPVAYGGEDGPDLDEVAAFAKLPPKTVIQRHCGIDYRVFMLGFLPGFAYMGTVDESIAAPRKATPRTRIPAGSVGIAGRQTGIYPRESPGGWQLIGRTSLRVFDPGRVAPALFAPGDHVKFIPVDNHSPVARTLTVRAEGERANVSASREGLRHRGIPGRSLTILRPGLFTTIQDAGRWGHQDRGVPVSGAMDRCACRVANALVGNAPDAAVFEVTLLGPEVRFEQPAVVAITGADLGASIDAAPAAIDNVYRVHSGSVLRFGERRRGARAYIAVDGGIDVPPMLGSRSTHVVSGLGGVNGRALHAGDRVPLGTSNHPWHEPLRLVPQVNVISNVHGGARLRVMRGPQDYYFDEVVFDWLFGTRFTISPQSDRMGYRLLPTDGGRVPNPALREPQGAPSLSRGESRIPSGSMISDATVTGGVQIPPSGDPILLMNDRQTTGGYPQIATVISADLSLAGQLAPGDWIEFRSCTRTEALVALSQQEQALRVG